MTPPNDELQVNRSTHIQTVNYSVVINFHSSNNPYFICTLMYEYVKSENILFACINTFALSFAHFESDMSNRDRINLLLCNRFMPFRRSTRNWPHNIKCVGCVRVRPRHGLRLNATIAFERIRRHKYMHNATHCTTTTIVFFLGNTPLRALPFTSLVTLLAFLLLIVCLFRNCEKVSGKHIKIINSKLALLFMFARFMFRFTISGIFTMQSTHESFCEMNYYNSSFDFVHKI